MFDNICVVFDMKVEFEFSYFMFKNLLWLVIDLKNISNLIKLLGVVNSGDFIKKFCYLMLKKFLFVRVVVELNCNIKFFIFVVVF